MVSRTVWVTLEAPGVTPIAAAGVLDLFAAFDRCRRAAFVFLGSVLVACLLIPIPIIHLLGIPLVLLSGILMAVRQLLSTCRLRPVKVACPKCGAVNRIGGGFGFRRLPEQGEQMCESCRRRLTMRIADR